MAILPRNLVSLYSVIWEVSLVIFICMNLSILTRICILSDIALAWIILIVTLQVQSLISNRSYLQSVSEEDVRRNENHERTPWEHDVVDEHGVER